MKVAFVSDSGTGKTIAQLQSHNIFSVPLQVSLDNQNFHDLEDITLDEVYQKMKEGHLLTTSLPALGEIEKTFSQIKEMGYDMIFAIPIGSGLSSTTNAMCMVAKQLDIPFEYVDCNVTGVAQEYMIQTAKQLYEEGKSITEIKAILENFVHTTNTLIIPNDLNHLRRGGRLTPLAATLGGLLKIKPILQINESTKGKIDVLDKVRTMSKALDKAIQYMKEDGVDECYQIHIAHAQDETLMKTFLEKVQEVFPNAEIFSLPLVSVVGIHTGLGCLAVQYFKKYNYIL